MNIWERFKRRQLVILGGDRIFLGGWNVTILRGTRLYCHKTYAGVALDPRLSILSNAYIGRDCTISCAGKITIGGGVTIGDRVYIADHQHGVDLEIPRQGGIRIRSVMDTPLSVGQVEIGSWAFIGIGAVIATKGSLKIGEGAVIGANSVVTKDVPAYAIVGGVPARFIRWRYE